MRFIETALQGVYVVEQEPHLDDRGFFARAFCVREFEDHGLQPAIAQCNTSHNYQKGTLRGMHYQVAPVQETKLIRCVRGAIYDVIVDMRPDSITYMKHFGFKLTANNRRALYVPKMFAHGYQTLTDDTEVFYQVDEFYSPGSERGLRYDDPTVGIEWPLPVSVISDKDLSWPYVELQTA